MSIVDHIVVAVDFSEPSRIAVRGAMQLATMAGTKNLTVLHALRPTIMPRGSQPELTRRLNELRTKLHTAARTQMKEMTGDAEPSFELRYQVVEGTPARVIPPAARDLGGTLLAVGTHARRGFRRWLNSSVVEAMLPRSHLPTLVLPMGDDGIPPEVELAALTHATVAVDIYDDAEIVARRAAEALAAISSRRPAVTLVTVVDVETSQLAPDDALVAEVQGMIQDEARARLESLRAPFEAVGLTVGIEVRSGDVEDEIVRSAAVQPSQIIVMGTHGRGEMLLDLSSTAADVITRSNVSVLVLPFHRALNEAE